MRFGVCISHFGDLRHLMQLPGPLKIETSLKPHHHQHGGPVTDHHHDSLALSGSEPLLEFDRLAFNCF
jgi:hypothetical protein